MRSHSYSIMLMSGECAGQLVHLILFLAMKSVTSPAICTQVHDHPGINSCYPGNV